jgi:hypothetical protein
VKDPFSAPKSSLSIRVSGREGIEFPLGPVPSQTPPPDACRTFFSEHGKKNGGPVSNNMIERSKGDF